MERYSEKKMKKNNTWGFLGFFPLSISYCYWVFTSQLQSFCKIHLVVWDWSGKYMAAAIWEEKKSFFLQGASEQVSGHPEGWGTQRVREGPTSGSPFCPSNNWLTYIWKKMWKQDRTWECPVGQILKKPHELSPNHHTTAKSLAFLLRKRLFKGEGGGQRCT